jgi:hypothetical protein
LQPDVDTLRAVGDGRIAQRLAAFDGAALQPCEADGAALAGVRGFNGLAVHLQAAHAVMFAGRVGQAQRIAHAHVAGADAAGDDGAYTVQREDAVQPHAEAGLFTGGGRRALRFAEQQRAQIIQPVAALGRDAEHRVGAQAGAGQQRLDLRFALVQQAALGAVYLGNDGCPAFNAEQREDGQVLHRLRHDAVVGGDKQQRVVDAAGAGDHGAHEFFVAGHIDEADLAAAGRGHGGVAEFYGDAAALFFGQAVGVDTGEGAHQGGLAVVDVPCGADDHVCLKPAVRAGRSSGSTHRLRRPGSGSQAAGGRRRCGR